jgi:excisionase family DNA binding protein
MDAMMDKILTVPEVATYLQMSRSKVYYLIQRKELPHIKIGRNVRIRQSDLEQWLNSKVQAPVNLTYAT